MRVHAARSERSEQRAGAGGERAADRAPAGRRLDAVGDHGLIGIARALAEGRLARKCAGGGGCGCATCGPTVPLPPELPRAQLKSRVSAPGDAAEREADDLADRLVDGRAVAPRVSAPAAGGELRAKPRSAPATHAPTRDAALDHLGAGAPLPAGERSFFEPNLGDLGGVRVHTGEAAAAAAASVNARAFTLGRDVVFGAGEWRPGSQAGRRLLAHELVHYAQQGGRADRVYRALRIDVAGSDAPLRGAAIGMMTPLLAATCPDFEVGARGNVTPRAGTPCAVSPAADTAGVTRRARPVGCCCMCTLHTSRNDWRIVVTTTGAPTTDTSGGHEVRMTPVGRPGDPLLRHWTAPDAGHPQGQLVNQPAAVAFGHELCGHGALSEVRAHPVHHQLGGNLVHRDRSAVHDPTIQIQNRLATEQLVPATDARGLSNQGVHRGESVRAFVVQWFNDNEMAVAQLTPGERATLDGALAFISANPNLWVDVVGHTSASGSRGANSAVGLARAQEIRNFLIAGTPASARTIMRGADEPLEGRFRFLPPINRRDTVAPPPGVDARRVEILCARYPSGAQVRPAGAFRGVTSPAVPEFPGRQSDLRRGVGDPCAVLLARTAWP